MSRWLSAVVGGLVGAAGATVTRRALDARPPGGTARWTRTNHAGQPVSLMEGPALGVGLVAGGVAGALAAGQARVAGAVAFAGTAGLGFGLLDDLGEDPTDRRKGLRGHLSAMSHGELTTGGAKVLGIGVGALAASALLPRSGTTRLAKTVDWCGTGALVAISANLLNLLDLRPGRALKAGVAHVPGLLVAGGPAAAVGGAVLGAGGAVAPADLAGRDMLGDCGANALGAVLAVGVAAAAPPAVRWALLAAEAGLTVASERISFTRVIERTPVLRDIDAWGRTARPATTPPGRAGGRPGSAPQLSQTDHTADADRAEDTAVRRRGVRQGLLGAAAMIAALTVVSRVLGMVRQMTMAGTVGAGNIGDAYNRANGMSNLLFEVTVGGTLAAALIPLIAGPIARREREETRRIIAGTMGWVLALLVPLGLALAAASGPLAVLLTLNAGPDVDLETLRATTRFFLLVFAVQVPLYGLTVLANAVLQSHRRFFWPAFTPLLSSLVVIATYLWYGRLAHHEISDPDALSAGALEVLAWGTTGGVVAMCVPALVAVARMGYLPAPRLSFPDGAGTRLRSLMVSGVAAVAVGQALMLVVMLATSAVNQEGSYTVWIWTQQVYMLPIAVFAIPLLTSVFPRLSAWAQEEARDRFADLSALTARAVVIATGAGAAVLAAAAPAVAVVFGVLSSRDGVDKADVVGMMTIALTWTVVGLPGYALMYQGQRTLFALQRAKPALVAGSVGWAVAGVLMIAGLVVKPPIQLITMLSAAHGLGILSGGVVAMVVVARVAGQPAVAGLARTAGAVVLGAVAAAVAGRWVADSVIVLLGRGIWQGVAAGCGAALVGVVMMVAVLYVVDRAGVQDLVRLVRDRRQPAD